MRTLKLVICAFSTLYFSSCQNVTDEDYSELSDAQDHIFTDQEPWNQPSGLTFDENLTWITNDQARSIDNVRYENDRVMGPEGEVSKSDLRNFFYTYYSVDEYSPWQNQNCVQLAHNAKGGRFLMFHNQACDGESKLLDTKSLRFYLTVEEDDEYSVIKGFNDFEARSIFLRGYRVGSLAKGRIDGQLKHFLGDLCLSEGEGEPSNFNGLTDDTSPSAVCSALISKDHRISDIIIRGNRSGAKRPLRLSGFAFSDREDPTSPVEPSFCLEETVPGMACTAHGSPMSDRCSDAGLRLINCRNCERICDGKF